MHDVGPPAVSADGKLLLLGDLFGHLTAFNTESLVPIWSMGDLGACLFTKMYIELTIFYILVVGHGLLRVAIATDENGIAVYASSETTVVKLVKLCDDGTLPTIAWKRWYVYSVYKARKARTRPN